MENNVSAILEGLNPAQQDAVKATEGPVLIVAGAGSGKTRVLTSRVAYLLAGGVEPSRILALTFTKKAAGEMKERIALMVGEKRARKVVMGTFHSVFVRFLRKYAESIDYPQQFTIYDTSDSTSAIKVCLKELKLDNDQHYSPQSMLSLISNAKNSLVTWDRYPSREELMRRDRELLRPRFFEVYKLYQQKLKASGVMDFDDILVNMNILLRDNLNAFEELSSRFSYVMVDEYQDTNYAQYVIIRKIASSNQNICVVGDDSQSIYAFRGAIVENILKFQKDYTGCKTIRLEQNYRSTKTIVEAANSLISHNEYRLPKECFSNGEIGEKIKVLGCPTDKEESTLIVQEIISRMREDHAEYRDFAILYRTNSHSRSVEERLNRSNIPYRVYSGNAFFDRQEIKDLMAYFKLAINPLDDESFKRAVNKPTRGIGDTTISVLESFARQRGISLFKAVYDEQLVSVLREASIRRLREFCLMIDKFAMDAVREDAASVSKRICEESGIYAFYSIQDTASEVGGSSRIDNIKELLSYVEAFVKEKMDEAQENDDFLSLITLGEFLEDAALLSNSDDKAGVDDSNRVALMTVHSAKGLEFPYVMIIGMEDEIFPSKRMKGNRRDYEEERRLLYVAITRAKKAVILSYAYSRWRNGHYESNPPSPFLREIDPRYLDSPMDSRNPFLSNSYGSQADSQHSFGSRFGSPYGASSRPVTVPKKPTPTPVATPVRTPQPSKPTVQYADFEPVHMTELYEGERIEHNRFGPGKIISITGVVPELKAEVEFDNYGRKTLLLKYAKMRPERK